MNAANLVCLVGRLTADPEIKTSDNGSYGFMNVAVTRNYKNKNTDQYEADFIRVTVNGNLADFVAKWFKKGSPVNVIGSIKTGSYTDKNGNKVFTTDVSADSVQFVPGSKSSEGDSTPSKSKDDDFMKIDSSEDLPW